MPSPADAKTILLEHRRGLDALVRQPTNWPLSNDMCTGSMSAWVLAECMSAWVLAECCVSEYVYTVSICVLAMRDEKRWPADAERWGGPRYYYSRYKSPVILVLVLEVVALLLRLPLVQLESYIEVKRWRTHFHSPEGSSNSIAPFRRLCVQHLCWLLGGWEGFDWTHHYISKYASDVR